MNDRTAATPQPKWRLECYSPAHRRWVTGSLPVTHEKALAGMQWVAERALERRETQAFRVVPA